MDIISRKEAKEQGLTRYYTGMPCIHGHVCERYTRNYACTGCQKIRLHNTPKEKQKLYQETYLKKHGDRKRILDNLSRNKLRATSAEWRARKKDQDKKSREKHYTERIAKEAEYREKNRETLRKRANVCTKELRDSYVKTVLTRNSALTTNDIPPNLILAKRAHLKLERKLKEYERTQTH